jgi:hypothetical protein
MHPRKDKLAPEQRFKDELTPEQSFYLKLSHAHKLGALMAERDAVASEFRQFKRYGKQCIMSEMTGKPCPVASYTIQGKRPSQPKPQQPGRMVGRERFNPLKIPAWVPDNVHYLATNSWGNQSGPRRYVEVEVVQRLLTDHRMKTVWQELLRKNRETGDYQYLSDGMKRKIGNARANETFPASTAAAFLRAVKVGVSVLQIHAQKSDDYLKQAHCCRRDADFLRRMIKERRLGKDVSIDDVRGHAMQLDKAANAYQRLSELAGLRFAGSRLFDNSQFAAKGFAIEMAKTMQGLYGSLLYGTVATIAQVALGDDGITTAAVHKWCSTLNGHAAKNALSVQTAPTH